MAVEIEIEMMRKRQGMNGSPVLALGLCTVRKSRPHLSKTEIAKPGSKHLSMEQGASYIQLQMNEAIKR